MCALYQQTRRSIGNYDEGAKANAIKNRILSDFYHHNTYNLSHSPYYDEPTYLSFRIAFTFDNPSSNDNLNDMPMPLLYPTMLFDENNEINASTINNVVSNVANNFGSLGSIYNKYSTIDYLINQKEKIRANYLSSFIDKLQDIEYNYPFYFKSIEGIGNLLKINPTYGRRLKDGENILTIKCLEGLDLKITELINLYKKIAWDDVYQRWVLPDMMRYFQMKIYISEIRNFHKTSSIPGKNGIEIKDPVIKDQYGWGNAANRSSFGGQIINKLESTSIMNKAMSIYNDVKSVVKGFTKDISDAWELIDYELNDYMPTLCITCNQCEFVIDDMMSNFGTFASNNRTPLDDLTFKIKVGNIMESQYYPLDNKDFEKTHISIFDEELYRPIDQIWSSKNTELDKLKGKQQDRNYFGGIKFGKGYSEVANGYAVYDKSKKGGLLDSVIGELASNAIDSAIGHIDQKATELLNRGLNARLGNTNLTVQGMLNSLNTRNILSMYSYVRDSLNAEMNTNAMIGSAATSSADNLKNLQYLKKDVSAYSSEATTNAYDVLDSSIRNKIKTEYSGFKKYVDSSVKNSEATLNSFDEMDASKRQNISNEYSSFKNDNSINDSEATTNNTIDINVEYNNIKHSKIGDEAFNDFLRQVANLPISSATEEEKIVIDVAKILADANLNTKELDAFFEEAKVNKKEIIEKLVDEENRKNNITSINGFSEQIEEYKELPNSEAIENNYKQVILFDEYSDLQSKLRKLALSSATDPNIRVEALNLYNILKNYINEFSENTSVKKVINTILSDKDINNYDRKKLIEIIHIAGQETDLSKMLLSLASIKSSSLNDMYKQLPLSEAVENKEFTTNITTIEKPFVERKNTISKIEISKEDKPKNNSINDFSELKMEAENISNSEATENLFDEMNYTQRKNIKSEYSDLKNQ